MEENPFASLPAPLQVISPGFVYIKGCFSKEQQIWLANYAMKTTSEGGPHHFITVATAKLEFVKKDGNVEAKAVVESDLTRGRVYDAITTFPEPEKIRSLCSSLVSLARNVDQRMPEMNPTHLLLLYYASQGGMSWHKDADPNDGDNDHPIVSISLGNATEFGYKLSGKAEQFIRLESGDVIIWGGPNRMLLHCVGKVHVGTCPDYLLPIMGDARLNFTYRDAPNILGKEQQHKYNPSLLDETIPDAS